MGPCGTFWGGCRCGTLVGGRRGTLRVGFTPEVVEGIEGRDKEVVVDVVPVSSLEGLEALKGLGEVWQRTRRRQGDFSERTGRLLGDLHRG